MTQRIPPAGEQDAGKPLRWLPVIIHPQTGTVCWESRFSSIAAWSPDGYEFPGPEGPVVWSVPRLRGARLADCGRCGKTGIQPLTAEDMARYMPWATVTQDSGQTTVTIAEAFPAVPYPDGQGGDEE